MQRDSHITEVGKRKIELSNLKKVLYPIDHILKAELIESYLKIAPTILAHIKGRPLTLVRYPDGIEEERFFQKKRPEWAPRWIEHVVLGGAVKEEPIDYVIATEDASLVWLSNLASIELHQMHCRSPHYDRPDYFVFDLDPPENFGYHPFIKTTGHRVSTSSSPLNRSGLSTKSSRQRKEVAKLFVDSHSKSTTLHIKKEAAKEGIWLTSIETEISRQSFRHPACAVFRGLRCRCHCDGNIWKI